MMLEFPRWKYVLILVILVGSVVYALPNMFPQDPSVQISAVRDGGITETLREQVATLLESEGVPALSVEKEGESLMVRLGDIDTQTQAADTLRPALGEQYVVALNLASTAPDWLSTIGARPLVLGLDLQGGVHFVLQIDQKAALDKRVDTYAEDARITLRDNRIRFDSVERRPNNTIVVTLSDGADSDKARNLLSAALVSTGSGSAALMGVNPLNYAIDGNVITIELPQNVLGNIGSEALEQNMATLRKRVNEIGVAEPVIQRQGNDRIVVQLPGVQDTAEAKRMIGATASLEYRAVVDGDAFDAAETGRTPPGAKVYYQRNGMPILLSKRVIVTGDQMVGAQSTQDQRTGLPAVQVTLNNAGGQRMLDFTAVNVGKPMAVVYTERIPQVRIVDGNEERSFRVKEEVISVANINGVFGKNFITTGLEKREADDLAKLLRSGSLAAPMDFVEERVIGPSLGRENVKRGVTAVVVAFIFTLAFFTVYYRMFGVITSLALLMNLFIVVSVLSLAGATMTLPGFAGLVLSIGLSVDANVLINERIREELRAGVPPKAAIVAGYEKASGTILDANLTGILAGLALFIFGGAGPLRGFAATMVTGIIASMFTAITVSRAMAVLIYSRRKKLKSLAV